MIVRSPSRRRSAWNFNLDQRKIALIAGSAVVFFVLTFVAGVFVGRATTQSDEYIASLDAERSGRVSEPAPRDETAPPADGPQEPAAPGREPAPVAPVPRAVPAAAPEPVGRRYAIVAASFPLGSDTTRVLADAERQLGQLKTRGFRTARIEKITIQGKGPFIRIIAMEANYPSSTAAQNDIEAMKRRGDLTQGFALPLEAGR